MMWFGALATLIMDDPDDEERWYGYGLVRPLYMFIGASGSVVTGVVADTQGLLGLKWIHTR